MRIIDVVGDVIINESGQVLCALRSPNMSLPGKWEFPGGKIEANETHEDTLMREIREELACEIAVDRFITNAFMTIKTSPFDSIHITRALSQDAPQLVSTGALSG